MNERSRYEDELARQLEDLPIPDEDAAWADMKRRLEEDDDDAVIVPPLTWGCGGWGLLLLLLIGLGWWFVRPEKWFTNKTDRNENTKDTTITVLSPTKKTQSNPGNSRDTDHLIPKSNDTVIDSFSVNTGESVSMNRKDSTSETLSSSAPPNQNLSPRKNGGFEKTGTPANKKRQSTGVRDKRNNPVSIAATVKKEKSVVEAKKKEIDKADRDPVTNDNANRESTNEKKESQPDTSQSVLAKEKKNQKTTDSIANKQDPKKETPEGKKFSFGAGLALFQQIPVAGQSATPYSSQGRKLSLADYIPSVYARLYRENKWFVQTEFRYGAPQFTKQFTYGQKMDTAVNITTTTSNNLKKTFYHQLPVSFNYYVRPNWSLGTGVVWNKFYSAVYEQDITQRNNITQVESTISKGIKQTKNDTSFVKSYFQALFETQYKWKRFSLGARYSFGLQPYIKFSLPGSRPREEKNSSLQIFLRYELWRSKKK